MYLKLMDVFSLRILKIESLYKLKIFPVDSLFLSIISTSGSHPSLFHIVRKILHGKYLWHWFLSQPRSVFLLIAQAHYLFIISSVFGLLSHWLVSLISYFLVTGFLFPLLADWSFIDKIFTGPLIKNETLLSFRIIVFLISYPRGIDIKVSWYERIAREFSWLEIIWTRLKRICIYKWVASEQNQRSICIRLFVKTQSLYKQTWESISSKSALSQQSLILNKKGCLL